MDRTAAALDAMPEPVVAAEPAASTVSLLALVTAGVAACGGGASQTDSPDESVVFSGAASAPLRRILGAPKAANTAALPSANELMDWAERVYWNFFPDHRATQSELPYLYRFYPATGNYLGVADTEVYVLGPLSGGSVLRVGNLADFAGSVLTSTRADSESAAARFLLQAQFSARPDEVADVLAQGYGAWLDAQMAMASGQRAWDWMVANGFAAIDERALYDGGGPTVEYALAHQIGTSPDALRKRVALAMSEYFVVSVLVSGMPWTGLGMAHYWDQLNEHAFGNFRQLLEAMTLNPAMGAWLNTRGNLKEDPGSGRVPDENYAREVMQLFTIGLVQLDRDGTVQRDGAGQPLPTYSQDDVTQLARIFTGYDYWDDGRRFIAPATNNGRPYPEFTRRAMVFSPERHSTQTARVLGLNIPAGGNGAARLAQALDILFQHPNVGPFFSRQMIQRLVTSDPSPSYVARVAARFDNNGAGVRGDLKAVWKAILLDDDARGAAGLASTTHGKVREPMVRVYQWLRSFDGYSLSGQWRFDLGVANPRSWYGQRPLGAPSVFNYFRPGYVPPGTAMAATGATAPEFQILNESSVSQWMNFIDDLNLVSGVPSFRQPFTDIVTDFVREKPLANDLPALVRHLSLLLAAGQVSLATQQRIVEILQLDGDARPKDSDDSKRFRVIAAVTLVMCCADYLIQK